MFFNLNDSHIEKQITKTKVLIYRNNFTLFEIAFVTD